MSYDKILEDDKLLIKAFGVLLIAGLSVAPGGMLIMLERASMFVSLEISKLVFISFVLSIPFTIAGFLLYLSHPNTLKDIASSNTIPVKGKIWAILLSSYVWGFLSVGILFALVKKQIFFDFFAISTKALYLLSYGYMVFFLGFFLLIGLKRSEESLGKTNKIAS